jgi:hypothetical protein
MSPATIRAPSAANSSAVARPMPIAAPVITADLPSSRPAATVGRASEALSELIFSEG